MRRGVILISTAAAALMAIAGPSWAKGSGWSVKMTVGAGRSPRVLTIVGDIWEQQAGLFDADLKQSSPPLIHLGPGYPVAIAGPCGDGSAFALRQTVYPYPRLGPWTYTPPNQPYCRWVAPPAGWFAAPRSLFDAITAAGLPARPPAIERATGRAEARGALGWPIAIGVGSLALVCLTTFVLAVRRPRRPAAARAA